MKNKLLIILILFVFFICLFSASSFSFSNPITINHPLKDSLQVTIKLSSDVSSNFNYILIGYYSSVGYNNQNFDCYYICLSNKEPFYHVSSDRFGLAGDVYTNTFFKSQFTSNVDLSDTSISSFSHFNTGFTADVFKYDNFKFIYSNFDLKREDSDDVVHNNDEKPKFREAFFLTKQEELEQR